MLYRTTLVNFGVFCLRFSWAAPGPVDNTNLKPLPTTKVTTNSTLAVVLGFPESHPKPSHLHSTTATKYHVPIEMTGNQFDHIYSSTIEQDKDSSTRVTRINTGKLPHLAIHTSTPKGHSRAHHSYPTRSLFPKSTITGNNKTLPFQRTLPFQPTLLALPRNTPSNPTSEIGANASTKFPTIRIDSNCLSCRRSTSGHLKNGVIVAIALSAALVALGAISCCIWTRKKRTIRVPMVIDSEHGIYQDTEVPCLQETRDISGNIVRRRNPFDGFVEICESREDKSPNWTLKSSGILKLDIQSEVNLVSPVILEALKIEGILVDEPIDIVSLNDKHVEYVSRKVALTFRTLHRGLTDARGPPLESYTASFYVLKEDSGFALMLGLEDINRFRFIKRAPVLMLCTDKNVKDNIDPELEKRIKDEQEETLILKKAKQKADEKAKRKVKKVSVAQRD